MSSRDGCLGGILRSRAKGPARPALISILALTLMALGGCGDSDPRQDPNAVTKTISSEGGLQMKVPSSWREDKALNAQADLQASNRVDEAYALVISDSKQEFGEQKLEDFATLAKDNFIKGIQNPTVSAPKQLTLNGKPSIRYEIQGTADNVKVVYLITLAQTDSRFLQAIAWSLPDRLNENRQVLERVTASIRETRPAAPSPAATPGASPAPSP
jgi:hypothetical protein